MTRKIFSIIVIFSIILFLTQPVLAYQYWGSSPNPYKLKSGPNGVFWNTALNGVVIDGRTYNFKSLYSNAMSDWNGSVLNFSAGSANQGINMHHGNYGSNGYNGWTEMYKADGTQLQSCNTCAPTASWDHSKVFMNHYYIGKSNFTNPQVKGLATHEIGHALGLAHSNMSQSIMHTGWRSNGIYYVQTDDRNGISFYTQITFRGTLRLLHQMILL